MATHNILFALAVAATLALAAFSAQASKHHHHHHHHHHHDHHLEPAPSPSPDKRDYPSEPYPGFYDFVDECMEKLTEQCGEQIFSQIFGEGEEVSAECCGNLVEMGNLCHKAIVKATLELPDLSGRDKKEIHQKEDEVWSECFGIL